jgi:hypothetical protein
MKEIPGSVASGIPCIKSNKHISLFNSNGAHVIYYSVTFRIFYGTVHQTLTRILKYYQYSEIHKFIFLIKKLHFSKSSTANIRATIRFKTDVSKMLYVSVMKVNHSNFTRPLYWEGLNEFIRSGLLHIFYDFYSI